MRGILFQNMGWAKLSEGMYLELYECLKGKGLESIVRQGT